MAIPFQAKGGAGSGDGGGDGRKDEKKDDVKNTKNDNDGQPEDVSNENSNNQENDSTELEGACGGNPNLVSIEEEDEVDFLPLPIPFLPIPEEEIAEESQEGAVLYMEYLEQEIRINGLEDQAPIWRNRFVSEENVSVERAMDWTRAGRELRRLSDQFQTSPERQNIRQRATQIDIQSLDFENFTSMLGELFEGGLTQERILVLFCFCTDVVVCALRKGFKSKFSTLIMWSVKFIMTKVARWVHNNGGWKVVIQASLQAAVQVSLCCAAMAVVVTCAFLVTRSM